MSEGRGAAGRAERKQGVGTVPQPSWGLLGQWHPLPPCGWPMGAGDRAEAETLDLSLALQGQHLGNGLAFSSVPTPSLAFWEPFSDVLTVP